MTVLMGMRLLCICMDIVFLFLMNLFRAIQGLSSYLGLVVIKSGIFLLVH